MWISNTATTVMMLPIALSVINQVKDHPDTLKNENKIFGKALMLAVAYSASAGGIYFNWDTTKLNICRFRSR